MKITIISLNFYPEDTAIGLYSTQMAEFLAKEHQVEVITAFPYYPQWKINSSYQNKSMFIKEQKGNLTIYRSKQYVPSQPSFIKRVFLMISFTIGAFINLFRLKNKPDLVIAIIPFTSSAFLGVISKWLYGSKIWIHIQDFEFDAAIESGIIKKYKFFESILLGVEKIILNKADIVSTISNGMMKKLGSKSKSETYFLTNWIEENFIQKIPQGNRHPYFQEGKFNILYSGNIGEKQDWDFFMKVVTKLKEYENIVFQVVGDGAKRKDLEAECLSFPNVSFHDPVSYENLPFLLSTADLHILFQKSDVIDTVMPSKLLGMLASGVISVVTGNKDSEIKEIFEENLIGFYSHSIDQEEVINFITKVKLHPDDFQNYTKNAQSYVIENFSKTKVLSKFRDKLENLFR